MIITLIDEWTLVALSNKHSVRAAESWQITLELWQSVCLRNLRARPGCTVVKL